MKYAYPQYEGRLSEEIINGCCDIGIKIASEAGLRIRHPDFLDAIRKKPGIRISGERVYIDEKLLLANVEAYRESLKESVIADQTRNDCVNEPWIIACGGFSMNIADCRTDEIKLATCQDLRDMIKLVNSYGIGGNYPVMPQDVPPLMRAIACFKICWECSDNIRPYDYLDILQIDYIYEMHKVMEKTFDVTLCVPQTMMVDEKDIAIFLKMYPEWKKNGNIKFKVLDYPMLGITRPITLTGSIALYIAEMFSIYSAFNAFDPELHIPVSIPGGLMTDLQNVCWAWGSPRQHALKFSNNQILPAMARVPIDRYINEGTLLETGSCLCDEQAAMEKMGTAMVAALQGARKFTGAGSLCVDDLFSGIQFVLDVEMVNYIRQTVEAFGPCPDIFDLEGVYELLKDVCMEGELFISSMDTVSKFRNIMSFSKILKHEKLASYMSHRQAAIDMARQECMKRIGGFEQTFHLDEYRQRALDGIYGRAESNLL